MDILTKGQQKGLIEIDEANNSVYYIAPQIRRKWSNPEEQVQAAAYCMLVLQYGYPKEQISLYESVRIGSSNRQADIIVYGGKQQPLAVVECKSEVSDSEFGNAVEQAFSYAVAIGARYVWATSGIKDEYYAVSERSRARVDVSDIPRYGQVGLAKYKYVYDADNAPDQQKFNNLKKVEQHELTQKFKRAHDALWGGGKLDSNVAFDELNKLIFCKLRDENKARQPGEPYDFQIIAEDGEDETSERAAQALSERVRALYEEGRRQDAEVLQEDIRLEPRSILSVVRYLQDTHLGDTDLDCKGRAFETFMGSLFRGNFGQFFTPRTMVQFIVDALPIDNHSKVLDTSCGSGGFLLYTLDKVRRQAQAQYPNEKDGLAHYRHWHTFAQKNLFGIEVNEQITRVAKMNMVLHGDGHTNVVQEDGLLSPQKLSDCVKNKGFAKENFDFIITNPPFGAAIGQADKDYFSHYQLSHKEANWLEPTSQRMQRPTQNTEVLFIEQCYNYLREGGYLAIVLPDGILTNSTLQYVRDNMLEWFRLIAVVSMPQTAFMPTGAGVKSSIVFLRKYSAAESEKIRAAKMGVQNKILRDEDYQACLLQWERDKKDTLSNLRGFAARGDFDQIIAAAQKTRLRGIKKTDEYKAWSKEISAAMRQKIEAKKSAMTAQYETAEKSALSDYPIFMAIAEDIGYDATGRPTGKNELPFIGEKLAEFIKGIENGRQNFLA